MSFHDDMRELGYVVLEARCIVCYDENDSVTDGLEEGRIVERTGVTYIPVRKPIIDPETREVTGWRRNRDKIYTGASAQEVEQKVAEKRPDVVCETKEILTNEKV